MRPNHATVVAYLALFVALGGTAWALAAQSVGTRELKTGAVTARKIDDGAVTTAKIEDGAVTAPKLGCEGNGGGDRMVEVGPTCVDRYEASVWSSPDGGTQYGASSDDYPCSDDGHDCSNIYARSVPGVTPSRNITWFQAQQALANSGKRLPSNAEWQAAVAGTPDTADCNVSTGSIQNTGARPACISRFGANDMVGNLSEWVADWVPASTTCPGWGSADDFSTTDDMCLAGASTNTTGPGALIRGGNFFNGVSAGPFSVVALNQPQTSFFYLGFRGVR
jgi:formylglycine-generating enzyme required for sulfatase activity